MRLIDADRLRKIFEDGECPCKLQYTLLGIVDVQPTAFDADKVVEQLKQLKMKYFLTIAIRETPIKIVLIKTLQIQLIE